MVAWAEVESPGFAAALDAHAARALDHAEHRAVGLAPGLACKAGGQALHEGGHGRHGGAARGRVHITQLDAVPGIDVGMVFQRMQGFARALVGVAEDGRSLAEGGVITHGQHVGTVAVAADVLGFCHGLGFFVAVFGKTGVKELQHRNVQAIEPDNRGIGFKSPVVAVVMPGPAGGDDEVTGLHLCALAVHRGVGSVAFDDKTQRALGVAVAGRTSACSTSHSGVKLCAAMAS